ncbi:MULTISPECIES: condensation domain-containing protein [unclassified Streptomyces]|uniref:condensation domain-containing protein n=1 Tax=unclassified Streptomyces TaxID=2593676 RepID=UPI002E2BA6F7|nr:condensation domain-containing protein [Streptomyces sp. NBC_01439]
MDQIEKVVRDGWATMLGCEVDDDTNFFEAGGDSISAILLISQLNAALGTSLAPHMLFEAEDFGAFRVLVQAEHGGGTEQEQQQEPAGEQEAPAARTGGAVSVTSRLQERWFGLAKEQLGNVDLFFEVTGELDHRLFEAALTELSRRHAVLRSVYEPGSPPLQRSLTDWRPPTRTQDLQGLGEAEVRAAVHAAVERSMRFFDLESEVPFELELLTLSPTEHLVIGHLHHIATDGWSISLLFEDLERVYHALEQGTDPATLEPAPQYEAFAARQRAYVADGRIEEARDHWRSVFRGAGAPTGLPATLAPSSPAGSGDSSRYVNLLLAPGQADAVRTYAQHQRVTVYNVLLTAFAQFLSEVTGKDDLLIGTSTAGRQGGEDDTCLGVFISPMPLRISLTGAGPAQGLHALISERMRDLAKYRMYPFADLIESVEPFAGKQLAEVFSIHFIYQNQPQPSAAHGRRYHQIDFQDAGLQRPHGLPMPRSRVLRELEVVAFDRLDGSLSLNFAFDPGRFNETEVAGWLRTYGAKVAELVEEQPTTLG